MLQIGCEDHIVTHARPASCSRLFLTSRCVAERHAADRIYRRDRFSTGIRQRAGVSLPALAIGLLVTSFLPRLFSTLSGAATARVKQVKAHLLSHFSSRIALCYSFRSISVAAPA